MKKINWLLMVVLLVFGQSVVAQDWGKLLKQGLADTGAKEKDKLDSVDFQFAISINENAGFFDVQQKGEGLAKGLYMMKEKKERSKSEVARDSVESALGFYNLRMYKIAESSFLEVKKYFIQLK